MNKYSKEIPEHLKPWEEVFGLENADLKFFVINSFGEYQEFLSHLKKGVDPKDFESWKLASKLLNKSAGVIFYTILSRTDCTSAAETKLNDYEATRLIIQNIGKNFNDLEHLAKKFNSFRKLHKPTTESVEMFKKLNQQTAQLCKNLKEWFGDMSCMCLAGSLYFKTFTKKSKDIDFLLIGYDLLDKELFVQKLEEKLKKMLNFDVDLFVLDTKHLNSLFSDDLEKNIPISDYQTSDRPLTVAALFFPYTTEFLCGNKHFFSLAKEKVERALQQNLLFRAFAMAELNYRIKQKS